MLTGSKVMPFNGYLTQDQVDDLTMKAVNSGLLNVPRSLLMQGIPRPFVLSLILVSNPLDQFQLDLATLNNTERLANTQVPLVQ